MRIEKIQSKKRQTSVQAKPIHHSNDMAQVNVQSVANVENMIPVQQPAVPQLLPVCRHGRCVAVAASAGAGRAVTASAGVGKGQKWKRVVAATTGAGKGQKQKQTI